MKKRYSPVMSLATAWLILVGPSAAAALERRIPVPRADHPGNVFLDNETLRIRVPGDVPASAVRWRILDDAGQTIAKGEFDKDAGSLPGSIQPGKFGVGWYRAEFVDEAGQCVKWTTAAVLKKLAVPVPEDSPICVDSAVSWFAKDDPEAQAKFSALAALAGVNWVRDRLTWAELEPAKGNFSRKRTSYDMAADIQKEYGLKVLQVFHGTPGWALDRDLDGDKGRARFPRDLRDAYRFCRQMALRYKGRIDAWEPWNEANIDVFGGHSVDEMCSYQKAAYLGFKAGDPDVTVGWNVYTTLPTREHTDGLLANEVYPYFDTYNIHTYEWAHDYADLWAQARRAAGAKELWVTEADRGLKYVTDEPWRELSREDELHKGRYIAQSYVSSLWAGSSRHFHFILGDYFERNNGVQFGLLRKDMTPRPGYVALAAVGRFLAGAKCLGRLTADDNPDAHIYVFRAHSDGVERDVVVAWSEGKFDWPERGKMEIDWPLPNQWGSDEVYDYLGRRLECAPSRLTSSVVYLLLPAGQTDGVELKNVEHSKRRGGDVCPVVLQVQMPRKNSTKIAPIAWSQGYEYRIPAGKAFKLKMYAYNFASESAKGIVQVTAMPLGWAISPRSWSVEIEPMGRLLFEADLIVPDGRNGSIRIVGKFGSQGKARLSYRVHGKADE